MIARPAATSVLLVGAGMAALFTLNPQLPASRYGPAALGAGTVLLVGAWLLRELGRRERLAILAGAAVLGFLAGVAAGKGSLGWPLGFGAAWLPLLFLLLAGLGRERLAIELERLEEEADQPEARAGVLARATKIRDEARVAADRVDPDRKATPADAGDARSIYAYAAQVAGYALALEGRHEEAAASLGEVPEAWMPEPLRPLLLSNLSHWYLCAGDVDAAARALEGVREEDALPEARPVVRAARAAVLVRSGQVDAALDIVGRADLEQNEPAMVRQRYRVTRAHALAAQGDAAGARAELERVLEEAGSEELRRWLPAGGPAMGLMEELTGTKAAARRPRARRRAAAKQA